MVENTNPKTIPRSLFLFISIVILCLAASTSKGQQEWQGPVPKVPDLYSKIGAKFHEYSVVLEPDKPEPEYWAGAPSVVRGPDGTFWLAARMRSPEHPRGLRGYEIRILKSDDGVHFTKAHSIHRKDVPIPGFERPAMLLDPETGKFKLYACGPWQESSWCIIKFDDVDNPTKFDPTTARPVIQAPGQTYPRDVSVIEYKDPFIIYGQGSYHCYVTGYIRRNERLFHYTSADGEKWMPEGDINQPILDLSGWHNFFVRPASVLPLGIGYLFVYEGSSTQWYDPVYNVVTGLGFTFDLHQIIDLTPDAPLFISNTPRDFYTWRYSHWMIVDEILFIYAEVAREDHAHEIRLFRISMKD